MHEQPQFREQALEQEQEQDQAQVPEQEPEQETNHKLEQGQEQEHQHFLGQEPPVVVVVEEQHLRPRPLSPAPAARSSGNYTTRSACFCQGPELDSQQ